MVIALFSRVCSVTVCLVVFIVGFLRSAIGFPGDDGDFTGGGGDFAAGVGDFSAGVDGLEGVSGRSEPPRNSFSEDIVTVKGQKNP